MKKVTVTLQKSYDIIIGSGLLDSAGGYLRALTDSPRIAVISDETVAELYLARLEASLRGQGFTEIFTCAFPPGEHSKTLATAGRLYEFLAESGIVRGDLIVALGGGVVGDAAGFAASTYLRGTRFVQLPTTLLAQVDSSVGGKTAVDLPCGKNLVGTFWQPSLVLCDTALLSTLSGEVFADGAAEVIKYGAIRDKKLFGMISSPDYAVHLEEIICRCIEIKRDIVQADEFDTGERMLLNFGHTLGHAIERESGYEIPHGRAVAIGMAMITRAAAAAGITPTGVTAELERACAIFGLPTAVDMPTEALINHCRNDKKRDNLHLNMILLEEIGAARIYRMALDDFKCFVCEGCK